MKFEYSTKNSYRPQWGDINWHERYAQEHVGEDIMELWLDREDGKGAFQITQDNCFVELNRVDPELDRIMINTNRTKDGQPEWMRWFRWECGEQVFVTMLERVDLYSTKTVTFYPRQNPVEMYLNLGTVSVSGIEQQLEKWKEIPEPRQPEG
jgi:hypothetical protein